MNPLHRPVSFRSRGRLPGLLLCAALWALAGPALAYQVRINGNNVQLKPKPDQRSAALTRLNPQKVQLIGMAYAGDGELWIRVNAGRATGWVQARMLDPALKDNTPLRLADLPGPLLFDHAQREILYKSNLNDPALKGHLRRWTLVMEMGQLKAQWDSARQRLNFLEISRRVGVKVSDAEYQGLQAEIRQIEQKFQRSLSEWQRS